MKLEIFPTKDELEQHKKLIPEINPSAVLAMLEIMEASELIHSRIQQVLERQYQISEGKLRVMIILHQHQDGISPSTLALRAGVTKATISVMLRRMQRDDLITMLPAPDDKRGKIAQLTPTGRAYVDTILPEHYARISRMMSALTEAEQHELIHLLEKLGTNDI